MWRAGGPRFAHGFLDRTHLGMGSHENLLGYITRNLQDPCDASCPARLMTGTKACPCIRMEIFIKQHKFFPERIGMEGFTVAIDRSSAVRIRQKDTHQAIADLLRHFIEGHQLS